MPKCMIWIHVLNSNLDTGVQLTSHGDIKITVLYLCVVQQFKLFRILMLVFLFAISLFAKHNRRLVFFEQFSFRNEWMCLKNIFAFRTHTPEGKETLLLYTLNTMIYLHFSDDKTKPILFSPKRRSNQNQQSKQISLTRKSKYI